MIGQWTQETNFGTTLFLLPRVSGCRIITSGVTPSSRRRCLLLLGLLAEDGHHSSQLCSLPRCVKFCPASYNNAPFMPQETHKPKEGTCSSNRDVMEIHILIPLFSKGERQLLHTMNWRHPSETFLVTPLSPRCYVSVRRGGLTRDLVGELKGKHRLEINSSLIRRTGCDD